MEPVEIATATALATDGSGYDPQQATDTALTEIQRVLQTYHATTAVVRHPPDTRTQVRTRYDPHQVVDDPHFGDLPADGGTITVRWFAGPTADADPEFSFHYVDDAGFEVGWHRHPEPHVATLSHRQWRTPADQADEYHREETTYDSHRPVPLCWEILERLADELKADT